MKFNNILELRKKCPSMEFFLIRISPIFGLISLLGNIQAYRLGKTLYLCTLHALYTPDLKVFSNIETRQKLCFFMVKIIVKCVRTGLEFQFRSVTYNLVAKIYKHFESCW